MAAEASPPSLTLLFSSDSTPLGLTTSNTKSVAWPPSCNPILTSSSAYMAGGPQGPVKFEPLRHDIAPRPMLAPIPIAPFLTEGRTITHSARSRIGLGRLSGMFRISISTSPALFEPFLFFLLGLRNHRQNPHRPW